jgi:phosphate transport system substrate-binding protein
MNIGTRIKNLFKDMWNNTEAVSPIVATLVLVTVAIAGAAGVGMIQGTFSSSVAEDAGSSELAQGVKVTVQGGGSGAGVSSTGMDIVDIGAASRDPKPEEMTKFPDIKTHKIGGSAVVVIVNGLSGNFTDKDELKNVFTLADDAGKVDLSVDGNGNITCAAGTTHQVYQRAEASGTEDTFNKYLKITIDDSKAEGKNGNAGVLKAVEDTTDSIGFVDFGFADGSTVAALNMTGVEGYLPTEDNIKDQLKTDGTSTVTYPYKLARPLNYLTNGEPNSMEQAFITFAMSPGATTYFEECGYFPVTTIA